MNKLEEKKRKHEVDVYSAIMNCLESQIFLGTT